MEKYEARVIGETSAGMTGLEIDVDGELYWSIDIFENGASESWYKKGLRQVFDVALDCETVKDWAEFDINDNDEKVVKRLDTSDTTWVVATYNPQNGWIFTNPIHDGQSWDFIKENSDRIPADVVAAWTEKME